MAHYQSPSKENWSGRNSDDQLYLHEKVEFEMAENLPNKGPQFAILGYCCDEGVRRNQGRVGAKEGPDAIRKALGKMPNHLATGIFVADVGDVVCDNGHMEEAQNLLADQVNQLLQKKCFPIVLGGGHDIAYGHYKGLQQFLKGEKQIGIINFDAHFDLRNNANGSNSGTPFFQIAKENSTFHYLCLGIRRDANDRQLYKTANEMGADYLEVESFTIHNIEKIKAKINSFLEKVDHIYVTIDLDGFSSAYAPGVSAASPMGFAPDVVLACLDAISNSNKSIGMDLAEMNPKYDIDGQTAKLAATLVHFVIHKLAKS